MKITARCVAFLLALVAGSLAACDPDAAMCMLALDYHHDRCQKGDQESCDWIAEHGVPTCH